jgi:hypothetical protein
VRWSIIVGLFAACVVAACAARKPIALNQGLHVQVVEFDTRKARVLSWDDQIEPLGFETAQRIANALRIEYGIDAIAVRANEPADADLVVTGQVTTIDGGSRGARWAVGWLGTSAGAVYFGVGGSVRRSDGSLVDSFALEERAKWGAAGGNTIEMMHECVEWVSERVARMVATGDYARE